MNSNEAISRTQTLIEICAKRSWTFGLAESCTGGLLSAWISSQSGVSACFKGSVVSYAREVKENVLKVPSPIILANGEVSLPTAKAMAVGAKKVLGSDWAVSITGVAGPSGGTLLKPVGYVCFAVIGPGFERVVQQQFDAHGERQDIQRQSALFAFDLLLNAMR